MENNLKYNCNKFGIYKITNTITNDFYIGSTFNTFYNRYRNHKSYVKLKKSNSILYNAIDKYGIDNFKFEIVEECTEISTVRQKEEDLIAKLKPKYNICTKPTLSGIPNLNRKLTKEWKNNIAKGIPKKHDDKTKAVLNKINKQRATKVTLRKKGKTYKFNSLILACDFIKCNRNSIRRAYKEKTTVKGYEVLKLEHMQHQKVRLYILDEFIEFNSMSECDKYLGLWKGCTSSYLKRGMKVQHKYIVNIVD